MPLRWSLSAGRTTVLCLVALCGTPATNSFSYCAGCVRLPPRGMPAGRAGRRYAVPAAPRMQQGDWTSPGGENRRDLADQSPAPLQGSSRAPGSSTPAPGARAGGDGRVGGNELRMADGARRMTPGERIDAMVSPMETGVLRDQKDAKGLSQKQTLQDTVSAGEDWWAGDSVDLGSDPNALPPGWVQQEMTRGAPVYYNTVTGIKTRTRPKMDMQLKKEARKWQGEGVGPLDADSALLDVAFPSSYWPASQADQSETGAGVVERVEPVAYAEYSKGPPPDALKETNSDAATAAAGGEGEEEAKEEEEEGDTRTLVRRRMQSSNQDATETLLRNFLAADPEEEGGADATGKQLHLDAEAARYVAEPDDELVPILRISAEGDVLAASASESEERKASDVSQRDGSYKVPEHLLPGNNAAQMNWAERQLAQAQQQQRPLADLPGFAANYLKIQAAEGQETAQQGGDAVEEYEVTKPWNPIPWKDPEARQQKRKVLRTVAQVTEETQKKVASAPSEAEVLPKSEQEQMDRVLGVLFDDDAQVSAAKAAGLNGKSSAQLVDSALQGSLGKAIDEREAVDPDARSFTFVDEHQCIGCYNCAMIARNTFMMEDDHGRARVFQQKGDIDEVIEEAIASCPVDCIHGVTLDELRQLEVEREHDVINNKSRLVGGSYTAEEKGGTPWLRLLARRAEQGKGTFLGF